MAIKNIGVQVQPHVDAVIHQLLFKPSLSLQTRQPCVLPFQTYRVGRIGHVEPRIEE